MDKKIVWVGVASFLVVGAVALLSVTFAKTANFRGTVYNEPFPLAPEYELTEADGTSFHLADVRGKIVLIFFGYTSCPDVCPATLANMNSALNKISGDSSMVQVVFISVDPERDTPEKIQNYVGRFNTSFIGLSGSLEELRSIWRDYGVFREVVQGGTAMDYVVNHTARITLIDSGGKMRLSYGFQTPSDDIANDIDILLGQR
jgi:protein SCO1